jgi:hypothetical protein
MKHFFSDYQHIWREFDEVDRAARTLMDATGSHSTQEYTSRLEALISDGKGPEGENVWEAVLEGPGPVSS